jgi:hypothetical protein
MAADGGATTDSSRMDRALMCRWETSPIDIWDAVSEWLSTGSWIAARGPVVE